MALLGGRDEEGLVADAPDGDVVIHRHQVRVAVPADDVLGGPAEGTREDDGAADACFELLWCEGHTQRVCERGESGEALAVPGSVAGGSSSLLRSLRSSCPASASPATR